MAAVTQAQKNKFIKVLTDTSNVSKAATAGKHPRSTWYKMRDEDVEFDHAWQNALNEGLDALEESLYKRGKNGDSDTAAIFLLKSHRPDIYRERGVIEHTGVIQHEGDVHITVSETDRLIESIIEGGATEALPQSSPN